VLRGNVKNADGTGEKGVVVKYGSHTQQNMKYSQTQGDNVLKNSARSERKFDGAISVALELPPGGEMP
jgi:hypothetical protein